MPLHAIREKFDLVSWSEWPEGLRKRNKQDLKAFAKDHHDENKLHQFMQYLFFKQWNQLKSYANRKGIQLIGDIPIFVGFDCADVWASPHLFQLMSSSNDCIQCFVISS